MKMQIIKLFLIASISIGFTGCGNKGELYQPKPPEEPTSISNTEANSESK